MPQKTFLNLSEDRKKEILNICFEEFALYDYESASLSRIINSLGLAKGSFYRYFENKKDLYSYLADFAGKLVYSNFSKYFNRYDKGFFENWIDFFMSFAELEETYPMVIRFRIKTASEKSSDVYKGDETEVSNDKADFIKGILLRYQEKSEIRKEIDTDFVALYILSFDYILCDFFTRKYGLKKNSPVFNAPGIDLRESVAGFINMARDGLKK